MNSALKELLCCPLCYFRLNLINNKLICFSNQHEFLIKQGIPILLDYPNLPKHSKNQQSYFEKNMQKPTLESIENMDAWKLRYLERFTDNFKLLKNKYVLEVGIGDGYMAIGLAKLGARVIACDITFSNLITLKKIAKSLRLESSISFICCSADKLPIKNDSLDYYVMNSVLEHIPDELKTIADIKRVLKKGGGLMLTVPVKYRYIFPPLLLLNIFHDKRIGHLRRYDEILLKRKFSGLQIMKTYFTGHPIKVIKVVINAIVKIFDESKIEDEDMKLDHSKLWSSNLIAFFTNKA